jgi:predicted DsbA family dithiol-disulfide isomerase
MASTVRAHRLSVKAYRVGGQRLQLPFLSAVLKASACDGKDIGSIDVLSSIAEEVGVMSKQEAIEFLKGDELKEEVMNMAESARGNGVKGVPVTVIDGKWALGGAQKAEVFVQIFRKLAAAAAVGSAPSPFPSPIVQAATTRVS